MSGSQDSGIATASSTAAPKVRLSPSMPTMVLPEKKMTLHNTSVRINKAAIVILLIQPKSVTPTAIHTIISAPMTRHQTQRPIAKMPPTASAPS